MKTKKAFTLIEIIICVVIFAILMAIAIPNFKEIQERSQASKEGVTVEELRERKKSSVPYYYQIVLKDKNDNIQNYRTEFFSFAKEETVVIINLKDGEKKGIDLVGKTYKISRVLAVDIEKE